MTLRAQGAKVMYLAVDLRVPTVFPLPLGQAIPGYGIRFGMFSMVWAVGENPLETQPQGLTPADSEINWVPYEQQVGATWTYVRRIACDAAPYAWPPVATTPLPKPPKVRPLKITVIVPRPRRPVPPPPVPR